MQQVLKPQADGAFRVPAAPSASRIAAALDLQDHWSGRLWDAADSGEGWFEGLRAWTGTAGMIQTCDRCNAQRGPWEDGACPVIRAQYGWFLSTADLAVRMLEESDTALSVYDIRRSIRRDLGINVSQETLQVSISGDRRFCWAGKGSYGTALKFSVECPFLGDSTL